jgi:ferric-dicitrate binding protein FerR (iron transport regulator)
MQVESGVIRYELKTQSCSYALIGKEPALSGTRSPLEDRMPIEFDDIFLHRRLFVGAGLAAVLAPGAAAAQGAKSAGRVEDMTGEAFAQAASARRNLERNGPLFMADQVGTGSNSRLTMQLGEHTRVRLGERARLTIDKYLVDAGGDLTLHSGPMMFDRPSGAAPLPVQVRSSFGLIAVRGTRFFAGPSNNVFGVFVERGKVAVTAAGQTVVLLPEQGTDIPRPGAPPSPPRIWGALRIQAAQASVW